MAAMASVDIPLKIGNSTSFLSLRRTEKLSPIMSQERENVSTIEPSTGRGGGSSGLGIST